MQVTRAYVFAFSEPLTIADLHLVKATHIGTGKYCVLDYCKSCIRIMGPVAIFLDYVVDGANFRFGKRQIAVG